MNSQTPRSRSMNSTMNSTLLKNESTGMMITKMSWTVIVKRIKKVKNNFRITSLARRIRVMIIKQRRIRMSKSLTTGFIQNLMSINSKRNSGNKFSKPTLKIHPKTNQLYNNPQKNEAGPAKILLNLPKLNLQP